MRPLPSGSSRTDEIMPRPEELASALGNRGVDVVSSPSTIGHLEMTCHRMLEDAFEPGESSVGVGFNLQHLAGALPGKPIELTGRLKSQDGRKFVFEVFARQEGRDIMAGEHVRAVVKLDRFLAALGLQMRTDLYELVQGDGPLIFSVPHAGTLLPPDIARRLADEARGLPDTDWHVDRLYDFASSLGATMLKATYSRYVVDLNRPPEGQSLYPGRATTGLCPEVAFDGTPLYRDGSKVDAQEIARRLAVYWRPYHERLEAEIERVKARHGYAILYDCHSILSRVPRLFEGTLPDLNVGTANGLSCAPSIERKVAEILKQSDFSYVVNGRFVGGHITRHYGRPADNVHALQMEIGCDAYLAEAQGYRLDDKKAAHLKHVLRRIAEALIEWRVGE